jgi:hypothetical protein
MATHNGKSSMKEMFIRAISVLGLIAILLLGAWGIIQLAVNLPGMFGSIGSLFSGSTKSETVTVTLPQSINSNQTLQLAWQHSGGTGDYSYTVSYACQDGLTLSAPIPDGSYQTVACNTPFNYVSASENMKLIPQLAKNAPQAPLAITVSAIQLSTGALTTSGSASVTILPVGVTAAVQTTTATPAATYTTPTVSKNSNTTYVPAKRVTSLYGLPDLSVQITSIGVIDNYSGGFVPTTAIQSGDRIAVQFAIKNIGTNVTPAGWSFEAMLPTNPQYLYQSQPQQALYPGDKIVYTLTFDDTTAGQNICGANNQYNSQNYYNNPQYNSNSYNSNTPGWTQAGCWQSFGPATNTISVTADPQNYMSELNKSNNSSSISYTVN